MREIKFRAWDKNNKQWIYATLIAKGEGCVEFRRIRYPKNIEIDKWLQYTGLKGKNGKEIYEGDIVGGVRNFGGEEFSYKVKFDINESNQEWPWNFPHGLQVEVIGNIYENSGLALKGENNGKS